MNKFTVLLSFMLFGWLIQTTGFSAEADAQTVLNKEINLRTSPEKVNAWIESNKKAIQNQSGFDSVKDLGEGKFKITKDTPRGRFVWVIKETTVKKDGKTYFKSSLVESIEGGIVYSDSEIVVSSNGKGGSNVEFNAKVGVNHPRVRSPQLKIDTNIHLNAIKRLVEDNVR